MRRGIALFALLAIALTSASFADVSQAPMKNLRFRGGSNDTAPLNTLPLNQHRYPHFNLDESYQAGTTWYDDQHNGTMGKMIDVDDAGWVHMVWTNGLNSGSSQRHVFYNLWDPTIGDFLYAEDGGIQIDASQRAGYISLAVNPDGHGYPSFHEETTTNSAHTAASIDFLPQSGAFTTSEPAYLQDDRCGSMEDMEIIWPHVAIDINGKLHVISSENPCTDEAGDPQRFYYSRGIPQFDEFGFGETIEWEQLVGEDEFVEIDTVMVLAPTITASRHSERLAIVWSKSRDDLTIPDSATQRNNDIYYVISEDGGLNWGPEINITDFEYPDWECLSGDTAECDRDSFRVYTDLDAIFDRDDNLHIVFTTTCYWALEGTVSRFAGQIWHWSDRCPGEGEISPIQAMTPDYLTENWALDIGDWQYVLQRPSIACDEATGDLYCAFQYADTNQWSEIGIPQADAWVSRSTDGGRSWSIATNISQSVGGNNGEGSAAGECAHEHAINLAEEVTYYEGTGYLHMQYIFDLDAGPGVGEAPTGIATLNPVIYQRIPINTIPAEPRWDHTWPQIHVDGSQVPYGGDPDPDAFVPCGVSVDGESRGVPNSFALYQNYPNPFNPSTQIQFDLAKNMNVTLTVFNVLGQEVATLLNNKPLTAGVHMTEFDATNLPSGVYVYQLNAEGLSQSRKMVLLK